MRLSSNSRKKKQSASFERNWHPEQGDKIEISFVHAAVPQAHAREPQQVSQAGKEAASDHVADLVRALCRAESRPGYNFVALKWFRDTVLTTAQFPWASNDAARREVLSQAIEQ